VNYGANALRFLIETAFDLYAVVVALRFLLQAVRADFYNQLSQFVVKATNPPLVPLRRIIPGLGGQDIASLVLGAAVLFLKLLLLQLMVTGAPGNVLVLLPLACIELLDLFINILFYAIILHVILSWVAPDTYNPVALLLFSLTQPVLRPIQRVVPPMAGLDLSPLVALVGLQLLRMLLIAPLLDLL